LSVLVLNGEATCHRIRFQIRKRRLCTLIRNFGNDGEVNLTIKAGKISARVAYLGKTQSFWAVLHPDGRWNGRLVSREKKKGGALFIRRGKISPQRMSQVLELLQHNSGILPETDKRGHSERGDYQFKVKLMISRELEVFGFIKHKSGRHYTSIGLDRGGRWDAKGWVKLTGATFLYSAEAGRCQNYFRGKPRFVPKRSHFRKR